MSGKVCTKCKEWKEDIEYSQKNAAGRKRSLQSRCKPCCIQDTKDWHLAQPEGRKKDLYLRRTYGMSLENYNERMKTQQGQCLLCLKDFDFVSKIGPHIPVVDHCHTHGHVRGILCNECNRGLGYFRDNSMALKRASQYLTGEDLTLEGGK